jgi:ethanolamine ammonia-lyase small subunit
MEPDDTASLQRAEEPRDSWRDLARYTPAWIALGRAGGSQRTAALLSFRLAHAQARDAVREAFHPEDVAALFVAAGFETVRLATAAADRATFLLRPDLGRSLTAASREEVTQGRNRWGMRDLAVIVSDGLSARAAERHALPVVAALAPALQARGWTLFPIFIAPFGRVKLQDEVGALVGARYSLMLLGERPGLGSPDSLGAYFTFEPRPERTDADRNCVSNIRPDGFPPAAAAAKLASLLEECARRGVSGVALKDTGPLPPIAST